MRPIAARIAAVLALPERVLEHHGRRGAPADVVGGREDAAGLRVHAERREEVAADPHALRRPRLAACARSNVALPQAATPVEDLLLARGCVRGADATASAGGR